MLEWRIGDVSITAVVELEPVMPATSLFAMATEDQVAAEASWLIPHWMDGDHNMFLSIHAFLVESQGQRLVIDTCVGNDRLIPRYDFMSNLTGPFLADLERVGFAPESVDTVVCTHLHFDHVGWNTMLVDGRWRPTFPNARYLFSRQDWADIQQPTYPEDEMLLADCLLPVFDAGQVDLVDADHRVTDEIWFEPTPGHTPGHVTVQIESRGERAVITGDVAHHPAQLAHPVWHGVYDADVESAIRTRRDFFDRHADQDVLVLGTHFRAPTAGHIIRHGDAWRFRT